MQRGGTLMMHLLRFHITNDQGCVLCGGRSVRGHSSKIEIKVMAAKKGSDNAVKARTTKANKDALLRLCQRAVIVTIAVACPYRRSGFLL